MAASGAAAITLTPSRVLAEPTGASTTPSVAITPSIRLFEDNQIELLDGPMRRQFDANHEFFLRLNEDRLLKPFRQLAGMKAQGDDMGGWYDIDPEIGRASCRERV